ncbi:MAG: tRNA (adenine-N1)-methyltransferase [Thermodesulfobacteriota bacterium]
MPEELKNRVLITDNTRFKRVVNLETTDSVHLPNGKITGDDIRRIGCGGHFTVKGKNYFILKCDANDFLMHGIKRDTQIIYPKDAGYILLQLNIFPGKRVGEAGTGSGGLTLLLASAVGDSGHVYTYEKNANLTTVIQKNLGYENAGARVTCYPQSLDQGVYETGLDAFFLDVREPGDALGIVHKALKPSGHLGILVPTVNQVMKVLRLIRSYSFLITEVSEIMLRTYKTNASRLRPQDRMVGHTGYLLFARALQPEAACLEP